MNAQTSKLLRFLFIFIFLVLLGWALRPGTSLNSSHTVIEKKENKPIETGKVTTKACLIAVKKMERFFIARDSKIPLDSVLKKSDEAMKLYISNNKTATTRIKKLNNHYQIFLRNIYQTKVTYTNYRKILISDCINKKGMFISAKN